MTIRTIKYFPKITSARTTYCDMDPKDMAWIQMEMIRYLSVMGEMSISRQEDVRSILKVWWTKRSSALPKGSSGQNSPLSFVSGLLNNIAFGSQYNLSNIQMTAIENISAIMVNFLDAIAEIDKTAATRNNESIIFQIAIGI